MATTWPFPTQRYLVPAARAPGAASVAAAVPDGFTLLRQDLTAGLPAVFLLDRVTTLTLALPTGLAKAWNDAGPAALVSGGDAELSPAPAYPPGAAASVGHPARPPLRLLVRRSNVLIASIPLAAGLRQKVPDGGTDGRGAHLELLVIGWDLRAGTVRGPGAFGSWVALAWRAADLGVPRFPAPPVPATLVRQLPPAQRFESVLGLRPGLDLSRFNYKVASRSVSLVQLTRSIG